jgi:hypothetical protein
MQLKSYDEIAKEFGCSGESIARTTKHAIAKAQRILARHGYKAEDFFGEEIFNQIKMEIKDESTH